MKAIINGKIILKDRIVEGNVLLYSDVIEGIIPQENIPDNAEIIDANSFYKGNGEWLAENKEAFDSHVKMASKNLAEAKAVHDEIEKYYINAMNFSSLNTYCNSICDEILS